MANRMMTCLAILMLLASRAVGQTADNVFPYPSPILTPGPQPANVSQTWRFLNQSDGADARITIDNQGVSEGAAPYGVSELVLRAQDEVHGTNGQVLHSSDVHFRIRTMSYSFAWPLTGDPTQVVCWGTQCGNSTEFYSDQNIRFTAASTGIIDWVTNNRQRVALDHDGMLYYRTVVDPSYTPPYGPKLYACIVPGTGQIVGQPLPCQ